MKPYVLRALAALVSSSTIAGAASTLDAPVAVRLISLCEVGTLSADDLSYLEEAITFGGPGECLARAILFRHSESQYGREFRSYFRIHQSLPNEVLETGEIHKRVTGVMKEFKGRAPAEITARVYLVLRGTADDTGFRPETMFRAAAFAAVLGGSTERVRHFSTEADKKDLEIQTEPIV